MSIPFEKKYRIFLIFLREGKGIIYSLLTLKQREIHRELWIPVCADIFLFLSKSCAHFTKPFGLVGIRFGSESSTKKRHRFAQLLIRKLGSFIRLWRVILQAVIFGLRPSDIRYASFWRIKYHESRRLSYHCRPATISLRRSRNITLAFSADLCYNGIIS